MMLNLIYCNPMEFIEENLDYDIFILPDSISIRNLEIHMLRRSGHEYFPVEKFHTIDSLALSMLGKNNRIIPRFMERYMTSESLKDLSFYRELHNNENFITLLLDEYNEIKENIIADNIPLKKGEFFTRFDERFSRFLERLGNGVNIDGKIWHFYSRADMTMILSREFSKISGKRIVFAGFYYISPTLKELLENARMKNDVFFISEPLDDQSSFILEKRLSPDLVSEKNDISFISEIYELPDMRREVRFIANFILERMDEENLKFSDFVVAFPEAKKYQWYVEEIFNEYSIPYFIETRIKFREMDYFNSFLERLDYIESEDIEKDLASIVQDLLIKYKEDYESIMKMWQAIQEFFFEIEALSIDYSKDLLISYLSTVSYGRFYGDYNTVSVVDIGNAHFRRGRYIIIGGMNEELFPRPLRGNIIFKDEYQGIYKRDFKTHEANEKYRLYSAILNFDRVIFTLPYFNSQGKRLLHSYLIDYLMENGYTSPVMKRIGSSEIIFSREKVYSKRDASILENNEVIEEADPYNICTNELKKIIGNMEITPTHITTYNRCPRKFLFMHVLGIRYPEEPLSPANQGNYAHILLKDFYRRHRNLKEISSIRENELRREIREMADSLRIDHEESASFRSRLVRQIFDSIRADIRLNDSREVLGTELPFTIEIGGKKIRGRIDRLD
ncbi:MAG: PD-(D/E)XK nuclease family protein, partial [Thermoplasmata archaeon]